MKMTGYDDITQLRDGINLMIKVFDEHTINYKKLISNYVLPDTIENQEMNNTFHTVALNRFRITNFIDQIESLLKYPQLFGHLNNDVEIVGHHELKEIVLNFKRYIDIMFRAKVLLLERSITLKP